MGKDWLEKLKVGDRVVVGDSLGRVDRLTKTQVHTNRGKFSRRTGRRVGSGGGWHEDMLCRAAPAEVDRVRRLNLSRTLASVSPTQWRALSLDVMRNIYATVLRQEDKKSDA